ncbi:Na+/H+ antiporter [Hysterangium stoloniferum]|nr:Na+/H+ antiporter [Hysterangium stoloniferum]
MASSHPYVEPPLAVILVVSGFLLCLNFINKILDAALYCGLIGQIAMGVLFGTPGLKSLGEAFETNITILGYLGLIILVYEGEIIVTLLSACLTCADTYLIGGLSTSVSNLVSSSFVSLLVAITGIILPIALSFFLVPLGASHLQAFAAGAALSATSLGTTLTILSNAGLVNTDVGIVLTNAALLDDIAGLVMLKVVSEISNSGSEPSRISYGKAIGRPMAASISLITVAMIATRFVLLPLQRHALPWFLSSNRHRIIKNLFLTQYPTLLAHTAILLILVATGGYAGTSPLLASFMAGVLIRWLGEEAVSEGGAFIDDDSHRPLSGLQIYEQYYRPATETILKPFFFASIGFSIPITQMFRGPVLWKGLTYSLLMFLAKAATGVWLWIIPAPLKPFANCCSNRGKVRRRPSSVARPHSVSSIRGGSFNINSPSITPKVNSRDLSSDIQTDSPVLSGDIELPQSNEHLSHAPLLLGMAMVARGEIGFLIASVAASEGVFSPASRSSDEDELYLVIVWAIAICTIFGPVAVGSLLRHMKRRET